MMMKSIQKIIFQLWLCKRERTETSTPAFTAAQELLLVMLDEEYHTRMLKFKLV